MMLDFLHDDFFEELDDYDKYMALSNDLCENGMHCESRIVKDIAKEEMQHASHLRDILKEHNHYTDEMEVAWKSKE